MLLQINVKNNIYIYITKIFLANDMAIYPFIHCLPLITRLWHNNAFIQGNSERIYIKMV